MSRPMTSRLLSLLVVGLAVSCVPAHLADFVEKQRVTNLAQQRQIADLKETNQRLAIQQEILEREWFNKEYCRAGKNNEFASRISQFIRELQKGIPGTCAAGPLQEALYFLRTQSYANSYFGPTEGINAIRTARTGQLLKMLDPKWFHPSTQLVVLVQPEDETEAGHRRGLQLGEEFKEMVRRLAPSRELRILGAYLLPCRLRKEVERQFTGPMDITLPEEPTQDRPRIRIWLFRTDCV